MTMWKRIRAFLAKLDDLLWTDVRVLKPSREVERILAQAQARADEHARRAMRLRAEWEAAQEAAREMALADLLQRSTERRRAGRGEVEWVN